MLSPLVVGYEGEQGCDHRLWAKSCLSLCILILIHPVPTAELSCKESSAPAGEGAQDGNSRELGLCRAEGLDGHVPGRCWARGPVTGSVPGSVAPTPEA